MIDRRLPAAFPSRLYHKDLHIVFDIARGAGQALPAASVVMEHIDTLMARDQGGQDISVLIELLEEAVQRDEQSMTDVCRVQKYLPTAGREPRLPGWHPG